MNPTPEQLQQLEEDFINDRLAGRLQLGSFQTEFEWTPHIVRIGDTQYGVEETLKEYIARRIREHG